MTKTAMAIVTIGRAAAGAAQAKTNSANEAQPIRVCVQTHTPNVFGLAYAKEVSGQIMASAGVSVKWIECGRSASNDGADAVIDLVSGARNDHPGALGYALPFEGAHMHSAQGIMKAHWSEGDYAQMMWRPMLFRADDTERIQAGLRVRRQGAASRAARKGG